jgi:hypothetical protein
MFVALWAYAYEVESTPMVDDPTYDTVAALIDVSIPTDRPDLDEFFKQKFSKDTGMWIVDHPDLARLSQLFNELKGAIKRG